MKGNECLFSLNKTPLIRPVPESAHSKPTASSDILGTQIELAEDSTECELSVFQLCSGNRKEPAESLVEELFGLPKAL